MFFVFFGSRKSFFRCFIDNVVHVKGLTNSFSKKGQLGGILACSSWSFKLSGLISFCRNIFEAHDIKDMISGSFYHRHLYFPSRCFGKYFQGYQITEDVDEPSLILDGQL